MGGEKKKKAGFRIVVTSQQHSPLSFHIHNYLTLRGLRFPSVSTKYSGAPRGGFIFHFSSVLISARFSQVFISTRSVFSCNNSYRYFSIHYLAFFSSRLLSLLLLSLAHACEVCLCKIDMRHVSFGYPNILKLAQYKSSVLSKRGEIVVEIVDFRNLRQRGNTEASNRLFDFIRSNFPSFSTLVLFLWPNASVDARGPRDAAGGAATAQWRH